MVEVHYLGRDARQELPPELEGSTGLLDARLLLLWGPPLSHCVDLDSHPVQQLLHVVASPLVELQGPPFEAAVQEIHLRADDCLGCK